MMIHLHWLMSLIATMLSGVQRLAFASMDHQPGFSGIFISLVRDPTGMVIAGCYCLALICALAGWSVRSLIVRPRSAEDGKVGVRWCGPGDLVVVLLIVGIYVWLSLAQAVAMDDERTIEIPDLIVSMVFQGFMLAVVCLVVTTRVTAVMWLGLRWREWKSWFLIAPAAVVLMWLMFGLLDACGFMKWLEALGVDTQQDSVRALRNRNDSGFLWLMRFSAVVVAPVCEEIIFRGYLYAVAKRYCGSFAAALASAMVFAAAHGSLVALLPLALFGILLVWLYEKTGSIWAPIATHGCFNAATVVVLLVQA